MRKVTVDCATGLTVEEEMDEEEALEFERLRALDRTREQAERNAEGTRKAALRQMIEKANSVAQLRAALLEILES